MPRNSAGASIEQRLLIALALVLAVVAAGSVNITDPDFYGHLLYGKFFAGHGLSAPDPFAYTAPEHPWMAHEYLSQMLFWEAYAWHGYAGVFLLKFLAGGAALFFLAAAMRAASPDSRIWVPVLILSANSVSRFFLARPQIFSFCLFSCFSLVLLSYLLRRHNRLWVLPPLAALWANMHAGFVAGLGIIGIAMLLRLAQVRSPKAAMPLTATLAACAAASLLNPQGWQLWHYIWTELSNGVNRRFIEEWQPLNPHNDPWSAITAGLLALALLEAAAIAQWRGIKPAGLAPFVWLLSCAPLVYMGLHSVRHVPLFVLWAGPVLVLLAQSLAGQAGQNLRRAWLGFSAAALVPGLLVLCILLRSPWTLALNEAQLPRAEFPKGAVDFMESRKLRGNVYTPLTWGSYVSWRLYPRVRVSMDGRNVTRFPAALVEEHLRFYNEGAAPGAPLRYATGFLLVPDDSPAMKHISAQDWILLFQDDNSTLFLRRRR